MTSIGEKRTYRDIVRQKHLVGFTVTVKETDLRVYARKELRRLTREKVLQYRGYIENYIQNVPAFATSLYPMEIRGPAPAIVREMAAAGGSAGVGPMAAVAGAVAQYVGEALLEDPGGTDEVIIENGGDVFISTARPVTVGIYAGRSKLSLQFGLRIGCDRSPVGVCTSSGTIGHSLSLGQADAVCVVSGSCLLADAVATSVGNRVKTRADIDRAMEFARGIEGVSGIVIIKGDAVGLWGDLDVVPLARSR